MTLNSLSKIYLALCILFYSQCTYAEWKEASSTEEYKAYVDIKSIGKSKDIITMASLYDFQKSQKISNETFFSVKHIREYDCNEKRQRVIHSEFFELNMGKGKLLGKTTKIYDWRDNGPNTVDEHLWQVACAYKIK